MHVLGWLGETPILDDVRFYRGCIGDGAPLPLEVEPSRRPGSGGSGYHYHVSDGARPSTEVRDGISQARKEPS